MTGLFAQTAIKLYQSSRENRHILEAVSVYDAIELCLTDLEQHGDYDLNDIMFEFMEPMNMPRHILKPYLSGKLTKGAQIRRLYVFDYPLVVDTMEYMVDKYVVEVKQDKTAAILLRPSSKPRSK